MNDNSSTWERGTGLTLGKVLTPSKVVYLKLVSLLNDLGSSKNLRRVDGTGVI